MYMCNWCLNIYETDHRDTPEVLAAEYEENFGALASLPGVVVCDNCYKKIMEDFGPLIQKINQEIK